jgi:hypothetical protein
MPPFLLAQCAAEIGDDEQFMRLAAFAKSARGEPRSDPAPPGNARLRICVSSSARQSAMPSSSAVRPSKLCRRTRQQMLRRPD